MLKKMIVASSVLALTTGIACASSAAPYIGAGLGLVNNSLTVKDNTLGVYRGIPLNVFAGYGGLITQSFYLAGELGSTLVTGSISDNKQLRTSYSYGASILPGVMLNDSTMAFGRVGVVKSEFTYNGGDTHNGAQFGAGLQTSLTQNIDLRGEYDFVAYQSEKVNGVSVAPRSDQFNVGLVYKFD